MIDRTCLRGPISTYLLIVSIQNSEESKLSSLFQSFGCSPTCRYHFRFRPRARRWTSPSDWRTGLAYRVAEREKLRENKSG